VQRTTRQVLVVDDDEHILALMTAYLKLKTRAVVTTCASAGALSQALETGLTPDVALVDYCLDGGFDGIYACRKIRAFAPSCVTIIMSGLNRDALSRDPAEFGVADFIQKPFSLPVLVERIEEALNTMSDRIVCTTYPSPSADHVEALRDFVDEDASDTRTRGLLAFGRYSNDRFEEAIAEYDALHCAGAGTFLTWYYLGHCHARLRCYETAVGCWQQALIMSTDKDSADRARRRIVQASSLLAAELSLSDSQTGLPVLRQRAI